MNSESPEVIAKGIVNHFSAGLSGSGLSTFGMDDGFIGGGRATREQVWSAPQGNLTVILAVQVDEKSRKAHVFRFMIERFRG